MAFKLKTPNPRYTGVTEGVPFVNGVGETKDEIIKNILVNDYGYELVAEEKPKAKRKSSDK